MQTASTRVWKYNGKSLAMSVLNINSENFQAPHSAAIKPPLSLLQNTCKRTTPVAGTNLFGPWEEWVSGMMDWTIWLLPSCSQLRCYNSLHSWVWHCSTSSQTWSPPRAISSKIVRKLLILHAELSLWDSESCPGKTTTKVEWELIHTTFLPYCFKCY